MKSNLLGAVQLDYQKELNSIEKNTFEDLELQYIVEAMAQGDEFIEEISKSILLQPSTTKEEIIERQKVIRDALANQETIRFLYEHSSKIISEEKKGYWGNFDSYPSYAFFRALSNISTFIDGLELILSRKPKQIYSAAFDIFYKKLAKNLSEEEKMKMRQLLKNLQFTRGEFAHSKFTLSGGTTPVKLLPYQEPKIKKFLRFMPFSINKYKYSFMIGEQDESMLRNLSDFKNQLEYDTAQVLAKTSDSFLNLFKSIKCETGFLLGVTHLYNALQDNNICFPQFSNSVNLVKMDYLPFLLKKHFSVSNTINFTSNLLIITGANQGGKTTFLKMLGQAQLLAQNGFFLPAVEAKLPIYQNVYTHFRQEEDSDLKKGKLAEELDRFSQIIDVIKPYSLILFNESFASTNEDEGSFISEEITSGLLDSFVSVYFVSHQYDFANRMYQKKNGYFISPSRSETGERLYQMIPMLPKATSYGMDIFNKIYMNESE
ncbi:hypothetical protein OO382_002669 [Listeria monocytogenes]|nr:hypothetical protein [Listeria monocytogenes]